MSAFNVLPVVIYGVELEHRAVHKLYAINSRRNSEKLVGDVHENVPQDGRQRLPELLDGLSYPTSAVPELRFHAVTEEWTTEWSVTGPHNSEYTVYLGVLLPETHTLAEAQEVQSKLSFEVLGSFLAAFDLTLDDTEGGPAFFTRVLS